MKKENRQMAQERRAAERKRQERKKFWKKTLAIALPILVVVLFIAVIVGDAIFSSTGTEDTSSVVSGEAVEESVVSDVIIEGEETGLQTDTSLTVADGDTVNIDYVGTIDGVEFSGGNTQGMGADLVIGSGTYIDTFEEQLIGAHPGDVVEVEVTFPEDYGVDELNGQDAVFEVTINGIYD